MLVAEYIFDKGDYEQAYKCYDSLYNAGVPFYKTAADMYKFSHQKFWILDDVVWISTGNEMNTDSILGNWGSTDYPSGSSVFPPYSSSGWRLTNRDFSLRVILASCVILQIKNAEVVSQFQTVLEEDYTRGEPWYPRT